MSHSHTVYGLTMNSCDLLASGAGDGKVLFWNLNEILKTSDSEMCSKPMHSYTTKCLNILSCSYSNDNLLYVVGNS